MRTTLDLDEDVVRAGKSLARQRAKSLGKVISELARIGMTAGKRVDVKQGFPVFTVDAGHRTDHAGRREPQRGLRRERIRCSM